MVSTALTRLAGLEHPIVLGPFGGLSSVELTAAVSELGGLGSFGLYGYDAGRIAQTAAALRERTDRPFALNIWLPVPGETPPDPTAAQFEQWRAALRPYFDELGLSVPEQPARYLPSTEEQIAAVLEARPAALSVVFGVPDVALVAEARARGILLIGTATTVDEAVTLERAGVDAVVATGLEAGGHRVSFLKPAEESLVGGIALVPQVRDAVRIPVIAAGGIADARGVRAARALGADGVQVGTAFLATRQSAAPAAHRAALRSPEGRETVLTRALSGRLARGIPNRVTREVLDPAPFPVQNWLTGQFRPTAAERGRGELLGLWAGQSAPLARHDDVAEVFAELLAGLD